MIRACALVSAFVGCVAAFPVAAAPAAALVAHRAVYDLSLVKATDRSGIDAMAGRMVYEFNGSQCAGYTTRFRLVTEVYSADNQRLTDQQTTTYENLRTHTFRFDTRSFLNNAFDKEVRGTATNGHPDTKVDLEKPTARHLDLPESRFPTGHMLEMIAHAEAGDHFYQSRIYDGSDDASRTSRTTTVIGHSSVPKPADTDAAAAGPFSGLAYWPASVAYFDGKDNGDEMPAYRISFKLYPNGVTRDLTMDYGDFVLHGKLKKLELLKTSGCTQ